MSWEGRRRRPGGVVPGLLRDDLALGDVRVRGGARADDLRDGDGLLRRRSFGIDARGALLVEGREREGHEQQRRVDAAAAREDDDPDLVETYRARR